MKMIRNSSYCEWLPDDGLFSADHQCSELIRLILKLIEVQWLNSPIKRSSLVLGKQGQDSLHGNTNIWTYFTIGKKGKLILIVVIISSLNGLFSFSLFASRPQNLCISFLAGAENSRKRFAKHWKDFFCNYQPLAT